MRPNAFFENSDQDGIVEKIGHLPEGVTALRVQFTGPHVCLRPEGSQVHASLGSPVSGEGTCGS